MPKNRVWETRALKNRISALTKLFSDGKEHNITSSTPSGMGGIGIKAFAVLFIAALFLWPGAGDVQAASISGQVTDGTTVLPNIFVVAYDAVNGSFAGQATTNADGNYTASGLPDGSYKVLFLAASQYARQFYNGKFDLTSADPVPTSLLAPAVGINAVLTPAGGISGRVTDASGAGIANIMVYPYRVNGGSASFVGMGVLTDANGAYSFNDLQAGDYKIQFIGNSSWTGSYYNGKPDLLSADVATVTAGAVSNLLNTVLQPAPITNVTLNATLTMAQEVPVPAVPTGAAPTGSGSVILDLVTKTLTGSFTTTNVSGATAAHIHDGDAGVAGSVAITLVQASPGVWIVPAATVLTDAQISRLLVGGYYVNVHTSLNPTGEIRGQLFMPVVINSGYGLQAYSPALNPTAGGIPFWYQDKYGVTVQPCLDTANCGLIAEPGVFNPLIPVVFPSNIPSEIFYYSAISETFPLGPNGETAFVVIALEAAFVDGNPLSPSFGTFVPPTDPNAKGTVFQRLRIRITPPTTGPTPGFYVPGSYTLQHPWGETTFTCGGTPVANKPCTFTRDLPAAGNVDFNMALGIGVPDSISTFLIQTSPTPPTGFLGNGVTPSAVTGGSVRNNVAIIGPPGTGTGSTGMFFITGQSGNTVAIPQTGSISGKVTDQSLAGIPGVWISVNDTAGGYIGFSAVTRTDGTYTISGLPAGSYKLLVNGINGYISQWYNNKSYPTSADSVTVAAGATTSGINATLLPLSSLYPTCDLNGDGKVDITDALKALKIAVGVIKPDSNDLANGDIAPLVNGKPLAVRKGYMNLGDAIIILQKSLGIGNW